MALNVFRLLDNLVRENGQIPNTSKTYRATYSAKLTYLTMAKNLIHETAFQDDERRFRFLT